MNIYINELLFVTNVSSFEFTIGIILCLMMARWDLWKESLRPEGNFKPTLFQSLISLTQCFNYISKIFFRGLPQVQGNIVCRTSGLDEAVPPCITSLNFTFSLPAWVPIPATLDWGCSFLENLKIAKMININQSLLFINIG